MDSVIVFSIFFLDLGSCFIGFSLFFFLQLLPVGCLSVSAIDWAFMLLRRDSSTFWCFHDRATCRNFRLWDFRTKEFTELFKAKDPISIVIASSQNSFELTCSWIEAILLEKVNQVRHCDLLSAFAHHSECSFEIVVGMLK